MAEVVCPGWRASWVNAWLSAVGATVLDERIRLHWTSDAEPVAVLSCVEIDPTAALAESWPSKALLADLPIATAWRGHSKLKQHLSVCEFQKRVRSARGHEYPWTLSSIMTDLLVEEGKVTNAPFNRGAQRGVVLHERLTKVHELAGSPPRIHESVVGQLDRVDANGLGFDHTRIGSMADKSSPRVEPIVEVLAFFVLALLPVRARSSGGLSGWRVSQRGWRSPVGGEEATGQRGTLNEFHWPAWSQSLDRDGIDALLDAWGPGRRFMWPRLGVHAAWRTRQYRGTGSDATVGFGADRL